MSTQDFLGVGWGYPIALDENGHIAMAAYEESIRQAIWLILGTTPGERVMRPTFGCGLQDLVFRVNNANLVGAATTAVRDALVTWEPRINVLGVDAYPDDSEPTLLHIEINYQVLATNSRLNLVYPFYLE